MARKTGLGFDLPTNLSQPSQPKTKCSRFKESRMKLLNLTDMNGRTLG
jgi:hypothetical protein